MLVWDQFTVHIDLNTYIDRVTNLLMTVSVTPHSLLFIYINTRIYTLLYTFLRETYLHTEIKWQTVNVVNRKWCQSQQPRLWSLCLSDDLICDTCLSLSDYIISDTCLSLSAAGLWRAADAENPALWLAEMLWEESERLMINHMDINNDNQWLFKWRVYIYKEKETVWSVCCEHWAFPWIPDSDQWHHVLFCVLQSAIRSLINHWSISSQINVLVFILFWAGRRQPVRCSLKHKRSGGGTETVSIAPVSVIDRWLLIIDQV